MLNPAQLVKKKKEAPPDEESYSSHGNAADGVSSHLSNLRFRTLTKNRFRVLSEVMSDYQGKLNNLRMRVDEL